MTNFRFGEILCDLVKFVGVVGEILCRSSGNLAASLRTMDMQGFWGVVRRGGLAN